MTATSQPLRGGRGGGGSVELRTCWDAKSVPCTYVLNYVVSGVLFCCMCNLVTSNVASRVLGDVLEVDQAGYDLLSLPSHLATYMAGAEQA